VRGSVDRPPAVGVGVLQGAFALWNRGDGAITAELLDVGAGSA
jgi:hypothetical protein